MNEDPRYLRNQSRAIHRLYRRNVMFGRWFMVLWLLFVGAWIGAGLIDVLAGLGWGYRAGDLWAGLWLAAGGCAVWLFTTVIGRVLLGYARRRYGPEPEGPVEG